jgi:thymus-specific serine protease
MDKKLTFVLFYIALTTVCGQESPIRERFFELPVDHFDVFNRDTFDSRYFVNNQHWIPGGVIFIYVTGGLENYDEWLTRGLMFELAEETNSYLFSYEQRYFGESHPTANLTTENLRFLTIHQSVADIASFINFIRQNYYGARNSRVILWGRGYGGNLAVWARQKYPHLVDAVWASSAPINMVLEYPQTFSNAFYTMNSIGGSECGNIITNAFRHIENAVIARNLSEIERRLNFCSPIELDIEENVAYMFYSMAVHVAYRFVESASYTEVDLACATMRGLDNPDNPPETDFEGFARWFADDLLSEFECNDFNRTMTIEMARNVDNNFQFFGFRQLAWLYCTQLGHFPTANRGEGHPFGSRFERSFFINWCSDVFGEEINEDFMMESINDANVNYGGLNPNTYRSFFTYGEMDPRHNLGPSQDLNPKAPVVIMSRKNFKFLFKFNNYYKNLKIT